MAKYIKKSKLTFTDDGLLVTKKGQVVYLVDQEVVKLANELDTMVQEFAYLVAQPKPQPLPSLDGFEREHLGDYVSPFEMELDTPIMDKRIEEAQAFAKEAEEQYRAMRCNETFDLFAPLFKFADSEAVLVSEEVGEVFDTPTFGDPLKLTEERIAGAIQEIHAHPDFLPTILVLDKE